MTTTIAEGFAYNPRTCQWSERVEYVARNRQEALNWIKFQRHWLTRLRIVEPLVGRSNPR